MKFYRISQDLYLSCRSALQKYDHHVVVANLLHNRSRFVSLVIRDSDQPVDIEVTDQQASAGNEIEERIVADLADRHRNYLESNPDISA